MPCYPLHEVLPWPALFLGYVLGYLFELYFFIALGVAGPLFFMRPISLTIILVTVILFTMLGRTTQAFSLRAKGKSKKI